jgi:hypothetical protein
LTVITGLEECRDDVSRPNSIAEQARREYGEKVADAFGDLFHFDPPQKG